MILDATCGGKLMYKGRHAHFSKEELVFMDIREGTFTYDGPDPRVVHVEPDKVGCVTAIPWPENTFNMVIFDPPHDKYGETSFMGVKYGSWDKDTFIRTVYKACKEFHRVLIPGGTLYCKVQSNQDRDKILSTQLSPWFKLLLKIEAHRASNRGPHKTYWMTFVSS